MSTKYQLISLKLLGILDFIKKKREMYIVLKKISRQDLVGSVLLGETKLIYNCLGD